MASFTPQFKHKNNQKSFDLLCRKVLDAASTNVTTSTALRDSTSAVKVTTDPFQFWIAH